MYFFNYENLVCLRLGSILLSLYNKTTLLVFYVLYKLFKSKIKHAFLTQMWTRTLFQSTNYKLRILFIIIKRFIGFVVKRNSVINQI